MLPPWQVANPACPDAVLTDTLACRADATIAHYEGQFAAVGTDDGPYEDWTATGAVVSTWPCMA
jgi:hypothetical protein